ncbi:MAG: NADP-specific glutamate dehydrogenase [Clostridia bacterium]|nr:NADP-specific glutamate dehydrogenase [Clostridia bacterium]
MNDYIERTIEAVKKKYSYEPEFIQTVEEVFRSVEPLVALHPEYEKYNILARMAEPDRCINFKVVWVDDEGKVQVNTGYRYQFNGAVGTYKGGLRFAPSVYSGIIKFLGFEQTFKNALTGLPIGGAKGGSDFDPIGKSEGEVMRFCQAFMTELYKYIGPSLDVPAGDLGVGGREIGWLFGQYRRLKSSFDNGVLTGKAPVYGGSLIRPEATGYGAVYYLQEVLNHFGESLAGKRVAISGYGNVAWGVAKKMHQLGAKVVTLSGPEGYIYDENGVDTDEKVEFMLKVRAMETPNIEEYAKKFNVPFYPHEKPWGVKADIVMPCATQNEIDMKEAEQIVANGTQYYIEVSNMPTTNEALAYLKEHCKAVGPSKAVNAGGVAVSALEMSQNAMRYAWSAEEVDEKLHGIMKNIYESSEKAAAQAGLGYDLVAGANIHAFERVAGAMIAEGIAQ